jgi:5-methyltetrahydrofolate--homocysteine methyltransferase
MSDFLSSIQSGPMQIYGAIGSLLIDRGFDMTQCLGQWFMDNPEELRWVTRQYLEAGCRLHAAGGSQCGPWKLKKWNLEGQIVEMNQGVSRIVKQEVPKDHFVGGSILPSGKMLKPLGDLDPDELMEAYQQEAEGYAKGGSDVILVLTMTQLEEAAIAVQAAKRVCNLPVVAAMSFDITPLGPRTMMGVDPKSAAARLEEAGADVVGHNCGGAPPEAMAEILGQMREVTDMPLIAKPNAGLPQVKDGNTVWPGSPDEFARQIESWVEAGAAIVGGCCGTTPEHALAMDQAMQKL